ncbi:zf-CGNR multi-domain protein [Labedella populi]|uniref:Zf-CGNR multi-domain protein n=1 Tax=Labedella populi TaxID=2498850 RepID=A0A444Q6M9_9MICO|nr:CGNR zinc finger domain-containing protein [Labedella populi]RWZ59564.1 zf-CGNR multi-domain protein [Labedella populi]
MIFTHDTELSLACAAALVNTVPGASSSGDDELAAPADLFAFLDEQEFTGSRSGSTEELDAVRALRPRLRGIWTSARDEAVDEINALLKEGAALPQLRRHDGFDWHIHATEPEAPVVTRLQVEAAMAFVDVVRADEWQRMRVCAASDCDAVLVDLSRNRSKRYCDVGNCGNRMNVNAYRERRAVGS